MEVRRLVQQSAAIAASRHSSSCSKSENCSSVRVFLCDISVRRAQRWMKQPASGAKCWVDHQNFRWSRNSLESYNQKRLRRFISPMMNSVRPASENVPVSDELKAQLEVLQQEASQARDRYESSRARFMRLAQVAEQLQQRAVLDLKHGNEGNARQLLIEKKKVMSAADVSKRRSQIYELLSIKLSEAISEKETQLMAALSSAPAKVPVDKEPTVRVIYPKENNPVSFQEVLEHELEEIFSYGVDGQPSSSPSQRHDGGAISPAATRVAEDVEGGFDVDTGAALRPEDLLAAKTFTHLGRSETTRREPGVEVADSSKTVCADNQDLINPDKYRENEVESQLWEEMDSAAKDLERDVLSLQEESETLASQLESIMSSYDEASIDSTSRNEVEYVPDTEDTRMYVPASAEAEAETTVGLYKENEESRADKDDEILPKIDVKLLFEEYLLDIDSQVAALESKLQGFLMTADILLGSSSETKDERVDLVKDLLQQIHSLRTRILDGVNMSIGQPPQ